MVDFIQEYFVNPILYQDKYAPYNIYNTVVYAIIAIVAVFLVYRFLAKKKIAVDEHFFKSILPFVAFGSILRVTEDAHVLPRVVEVGGVRLFPFVTPGIYVLTFALLGLTWFLARKTSKSHEEFCRKTFLAGTAFAILALIALAGTLFRAANPLALVSILAIAVAVTLAFKFAWRKRGLKTSFAEESVVFGQVLDASATFAGVQFLGYAEQHVVGNAIFALFNGPWAFLVLKIVFSLAVVELLRKEKIGEGEKNYVLLLVTILGLAPGLRDALRIFAGV